MAALSEGVSQSLASRRAQIISSLRYEIALTIPQKPGAPIRGRETIRFKLADSSAPLVLDFAQPPDHIVSVRAENREVPFESSLGHLVVPAEHLRQGENTLEIAFVAGDQALNRNDDYLYSLFVPARASLTFPCFDQPDLKGHLVLTLDVPATWQAVANGAEVRREVVGNRAIVQFAETDSLPTYLFGFAAGHFKVERAERGGRHLRMFHRETDEAKVARNRDAVFDLHAQALQWLEEYTTLNYPFGKFDVVLMPSFQFGGMEHPGVIFYNAAGLLLDETATKEQLLGRASTIAHETAHMWFGDLVTMKWFDDVWLKEVFANLMAAKIVNPSFPDLDHDLRFFLTHYPSAYQVDRTAGANPIRQPLDNLNEAGSLYGPIIYQKAPIVMRQLEETLGSDRFRDGLREYLRRYAFGNATWLDLIRLLDDKTEEDLIEWSRAWVEEPGRPTIRTDLRTDAGRIRSLSIVQADPRGRSLVWNQKLQVALGYDRGTRISPLRLNRPNVAVEGIAGIPAPHFVLPSAEGVGYGLFELDPGSREWLVGRLPEIGDPLTRGSAWVTLWDEMLEGRVAPNRLIDLALRALVEETDELNTQRILGYLDDAYWTFLSELDRRALAPRVEAALQGGLARAGATTLKAAYFSTLRRIALTAGGVDFLERVWRKTELIPSLTLAETDFTALAQELAVRGVPYADAILEEQLRRVTDPDRKARLAFVSPALSADITVRDRFFAGLADPANRQHEPWVVEAVAYLNHPLRATEAERWIAPSLELLREIQRTGDIFFPMRWMTATLGGHHSATAARIVTNFLEREQDYPVRLRQIIEQAADTLFRASRIVGRTQQASR